MRALVGGNPRRTLARIVLMIAAVYGVFGFILLPVRGQGPSMRPTLEDGQFVLVNRLAYWQTPPQRGDVVALGIAGGRAVYIKRIVGMPGDRVRIDAGTVIVNGAPLVEPYVQRRSPWFVDEVTLSDAEYLVIGDNRSMGQRSHDFGKVQRERVMGRVIRW